MREKAEKTFTWTDRDTYETIKLVAKAYGLEVSRLEPTGPRRAEVTLSGPRPSVDAMTRDMVYAGAPEPFVSECPPSRNEYLFWLQSELNSVGVSFSPGFDFSSAPR